MADFDTNAALNTAAPVLEAALRSPILERLIAPRATAAPTPTPRETEINLRIEAAKAAERQACTEKLALAFGGGFVAGLVIAYLSRGPAPRRPSYLSNYDLGQ